MAQGLDVSLQFVPGALECPGCHGSLWRVLLKRVGMAGPADGFAEEEAATEFMTSASAAGQVVSTCCNAKLVLSLLK